MRFLSKIDRALRKQRKIEEWEQRIEALHSQYPRLAEIDLLSKQLAMELALMGIGRNKTDLSVEELKNAIASLQEEKRQILHSQTLSEKVYEIWWDCPACQDTGFIRPGVKCECLVKEEAELRLQRSGLSPAQKEQSFDNFLLKYYTDKPRYANILTICRTFAEKVSKGSPTENLVLTGPVGVGKTHLSSAIANKVIQAGKMVVYIKIGHLLDLLRESKFQDNEEQRRYLHYLIRADLLLIDDLGTEVLTDFAGEQILNVLDERLNYKLPWVISTNLTPTELDAHYELRLVDRIAGTSRFLIFSGDSIRRRKLLGG